MIKQEDCIIPISVPSLDDMLQDSVKKELYTWNHRSVQRHRAEKVLKLEYLNFLNLKWQEIVIFCKRAGAKDALHHDPQAVNRPLAWAINWVYTGQGYYNFWDRSNVTRILGHDHMLEPLGYQGIKFETSLPPDVSFYTDKSTPCLVNTHIPHQVHALTERISFSLRPTPDHLNMPWDELLAKLNARKHA